MAVAVKGLTELVRAFDRLEGKTASEVRSELERAAEPVRVEAGRLAPRSIRNLAPSSPWARFRVGVTTRMVYVAPEKRRGRLWHRRNFGVLLMDRAMEPALEHEASKVELALEQMVDRISRREGF